MQVPDTAIEWCLENSICSNVELANISNVCQRWRRLVVQMLCSSQDSTADESSITTDTLRPALLLPSMVSEFRRRNISKEERLEEINKHVQTVPETTDPILDARSSPIPHAPNSRRHDMIGKGHTLDEVSMLSETFCAVWLHPGGIDEVKVALSSDDDIFPIRGLAKTSEQRISSNLLDTRESKKVKLRDREKAQYEVCAESWRGYYRPFDILRHFGYTESFVLRVFQAITESYSLKTTAESMLYKTSLGKTSFAARGATIARPESFCLCYDDSRGGTTVKDTEGSPVDEVEDVRLRIECQETETSRLRERYELQRDVLPRVVDTKLKDQMGNRNRSIQFLNASGGHAVCMMTPFFECGSLPLPITIIVVGIATEDGCFMSGLHSRFELGHLHPENDMIENTELSPVCIATAPVDGDDNQKLIPTNMDVQDESLSQDESDREFNCRCLFGGVADKLAEPSESSTENMCIHRGRSGPSGWHCYTFIIDKDNSQIRIDGEEEPMETSNSSEKHHAALRLDGLTIGSDHCFDISLCCGAGSDGEGEGAIAELAVFRGRLESDDLYVLEQRLMSKFGIVKHHTPLWAKTDLERKAQALFTDRKAPYWQGNVPLNYMTRHRSVSWHHFDPVSGDRALCKKIGCRPGAESSDWDD